MQKQKEQMEKGQNEMIQQVENLQKELNERNAKTELREKEAQERIQKLQKELEETERDTTSYKVELDSIKERLEKYHEEISDLTKQRDELVVVNTDLNKACKDSNNKLEFLKAQVDTLQATLDSKEAECQLRIKEIQSEQTSKIYQHETKCIDSLRRAQLEFKTKQQALQNEAEAAKLNSKHWENKFYQTNSISTTYKVLLAVSLVVFTMTFISPV